MTKRKPLTDTNGEVHELTAADLRRFKPADQVLPPELIKTTGIKPRVPQKAPTKQATTIRFSSDLMTAFKAVARAGKRALMQL